MLKKKAVILVLIVGFLVAGVSFAENLGEDWGDFLHYTKIGRFELAKGFGQSVIDSKPDPVELLALSEKSPQGYALLLKISQTASDTELVGLSRSLLDIIEQGKFIRRAEPKIIAEEIRRLSSTDRGRFVAIKRLSNAGEYAIPYMLDAMSDNSRKEELPNIIWALPQIGRDSIRPLAAALQTEDAGVKSEIVKSLGKIGYTQSLAYLKYIVENEAFPNVRVLAEESIRQIDPAVLRLPAAQLFYRLAEEYYYHTESLAPAEDADFANVWFWDVTKRQLMREKVDKDYFYELMAMRSCEWALKADPGFGQAIGLWLAAYFKAESAQINMPVYFGQAHADAGVYATTAGPEYLHQALERAIGDRDAYIALHVIEALATTAGERSLLYRLGTAQPLVDALTFNDRAVKYSAAIAIAAAGPKENFAESKLVTENLSQALGHTTGQVTENTSQWNEELAEDYALRAAKVMLKLAQTRNPVINLSAAQDVLVDVTKGSNSEIQIIAGQILARLDSAAAQQAIAKMALTEKNSKLIRIAAFNSLAISAKINASLLDDEKVDAIYSLVSSIETDPELRSAAAAAYGALNLPSRKVKDLILDQASS